VTPRLHGTLLAVGARAMDTRHGRFQAHRFHDLATERPALALAYGDVAGREPVLARVHSSCVTSEAYGACDCDCAEQLDAALAAIAREGRGVLFYLLQEGRGAGFAAKALDRMLVQASGNRLTTFEAYERLGLGHDHRHYDQVAAAGRLLGVTAPLRLLSNNPDKLAQLRAAGVRIAGRRALAVDASPFSVHYLTAKSRSGHLLSAGGDTAATLPEAVTFRQPRVVRGAPRVLALASYLLPLRAPAPAWFRLHLYLDTATRQERVVLTHGTGRRRERVPPLLHVQRDALLERFPLRRPGPAAEWARVRAAMVRHGAGCALFLPEDDPGDAGAALLLANHLRGGRAIAAGPLDDVVVTGLRHAGVRLDRAAA
jgi:GTP cyclohydrolase II